MSLAEQVLRELEEDPKLRRRMAEIIVSDVDVRLAIINAVMADIATKQDINQLRTEFRGEINQLRGEINQLRGEIAGYLRWTIGTIIIVWGATIIPLLLKLLG